MLKINVSSLSSYIQFNVVLISQPCHIWKNRKKRSKKRFIGRQNNTRRQIRKMIKSGRPKSTCA